MSKAETKGPVRVLLPSLDEETEPPVLRGVLELCSLTNLRVDSSYQRERMSPGARRQIVRALEAGLKLPDIELGMRGDHFAMDSNAMLDLLDAVYIIDGYQRVSTIIEHRERFPGDALRIGATVHFNTNPEFERERFQDLNMNRAKMSPSLLLRNWKEKHHLIAALFGISKGTRNENPIYGRVCWQQNMQRGELISGKTLAEIALTLHTHLGTFQKNTVREMPDAFDRLEKIVGLMIFRNNIQTFWELVDAAWGLRHVQYKEGAVHLRTTFLKVLARLMSDHKDFWGPPEEKRLMVPTDIRKKLARFPINSEAELIRLASSGGKAVETLYYQMLIHVNSGKRTHRLHRRDGMMHPHPMDAPEDEEDVG